MRYMEHRHENLEKQSNRRLKRQSTEIQSLESRVRSQDDRLEVLERQIQRAEQEVRVICCTSNVADRRNQSTDVEGRRRRGSFVRSRPPPYEAKDSSPYHQANTSRSVRVFLCLRSGLTNMR